MSLKVRVDVDRNTAIKAGSTLFGRIEVAVTDADLCCFTPEEREELTLLPTDSEVLIGYYACEKNSGYSSDHKWSVLTADLAGVRAALALHRQHRALIAEEVAQKEREQAAKRVEEIASALAAPVANMITTWHGARRPYRTTNDWSKIEDAPELAAKRAEVEAEIDRLNDKYEAEQVREKAKKIERDAAKEAAQTAAKEDFRAFALSGHAGAVVARAAAEQYDVMRDVISAVAQQLPEPDAISAPDDKWSWEERPSPSEAAFRLHDTLTGAVQAVQHKPSSISLCVSRIMRITEPDSEDGEEGAKRTGVVVTISSPLTKDRQLLYFVEP